MDFFSFVPLKWINFRKPIVFYAKILVSRKNLLFSPHTVFYLPCTTDYILDFMLLRSRYLHNCGITRTINSTGKIKFIGSDSCDSVGLSRGSDGKKQKWQQLLAKSRSVTKGVFCLRFQNIWSFKIV